MPYIICVNEYLWELITESNYKDLNTMSLLVS
jgi:hypothetical protein